MNLNRAGHHGDDHFDNVTYCIRIAVKDVVIQLLFVFQGRIFFFFVF